MPVQVRLSAPFSSTQRAQPAQFGLQNRTGSGQHRGARPFHSAPVAEQTTSIRLLSGTTQVRLLPGANCRSGGDTECAPRFSVALPRKEFLSTHRVCGPPVKRCELGAMPRRGAISSAAWCNSSTPGSQPGTRRAEAHTHNRGAVTA